MKYTKKQIDFIEHYLSNGYNGTKAALSAGYSEKTAYSIANELLKKPEIQALIKEKQNEIAKRNNITKDGLIRILINIANDEQAKNSDKIKSIEVMLKALGFNEPDKIEHSGGIENKIIKIKFKKPDED